MNNKHKELNFEYGYAVITENPTKLMEIGWNQKIKDFSEKKGLVSKSYDTIIPLSETNKNIKVFKDGNIIVQKTFKTDLPNSGVKNYHYKIKDYKLCEIKNLNSNYIDQVNDNVVILQNNNEEEISATLYDVVKGEYISEMFSKISSFRKESENKEEEFAKAVLNVDTYKTNRLSCEVICYIDKSGNIRTPLYVPYNNIYIETNTEDFDFNSAIDKIKYNLQSNFKNPESSEKKLKRLIL